MSELDLIRLKMAAARQGRDPQADEPAPSIKNDFAIDDFEAAAIYGLIQKMIIETPDTEWSCLVPLWERLSRRFGPLE